MEELLRLALTTRESCKDGFVSQKFSQSFADYSECNQTVFTPIRGRVKLPKLENKTYILALRLAKILGDDGSPNFFANFLSSQSVVLSW